MGLGTDLQALKGARPRTFTQWLETASMEDIDVVYAAIHARNIPAETLVRTLRANGVPMTTQTIKAIRDAQN